MKIEKSKTAVVLRKYRCRPLAIVSTTAKRSSFQVRIGDIA